jgi:hypothetical protein
MPVIQASDCIKNAVPGFFCPSRVPKWHLVVHVDSIWTQPSADGLGEDITGQDSRDLDLFFRYVFRERMNTRSNRSSHNQESATEVSTNT